ncbi:MAG: Tol-Pal system beta propeller repeat protein TolB [Gammaproteobacteria bacterium]|nr:MAG: Tol-Pal system beta propeller repeat protein TolB [Gammaproteobacteria bacterium]
MMKKLLIGLLILSFTSVAQAVLKIDITEGVEGALPIAVIPFQWKGGAKVTHGDVSAIVTSDLARSGQFSPVAEQDLIARPQRLADVHYKTWRIAGMDHIVIGSVTKKVDGTYNVEFRLIDILKAKQVLGYSFTATNDTLRTISHQISDYVFSHITGLPGAFSTRIAYVTSVRDKSTTKSRLQVSDTDGYNPQTLLTSEQPIMSPAWSPDGSQLAYVSFESGQAEIYTHNIRTGARKSRAKFPGLNGSPAWSPDGKKLALTLSKDGNPEIYILNLLNNRLQRVTNHWAIDTEAVWTTDGKFIIYTSSRSGKPQLYRQSASRVSKPERLTYEGNYNASASVSADGKYVAYVHGEGNTYRIAVLELATKSSRILTDGPLDESPEYAPNNSMILFASQEKKQAVLAAVSVDGRQKQRLAFTAGEVREPSWAAVRH